MNKTNIKPNTLNSSIAAPVEMVFEFSTNPNNTPTWISTITKETIDTDKPRLGTVYTNEHGTLKVTAFEKDKLFEIRDVKGIFAVRYEYKSTSPETSELEYSEWMIDGSIFPDPTSRETLVKLKEAIEANTKS